MTTKTINNFTAAGALSSTDIFAGYQSDTVKIQLSSLQTYLAANSNAQITQIRANTTITAAHANTLLWILASSPITITLPQQTTTALPLGFRFKFLNESLTNISFAVQGSDDLVPIFPVAPTAAGEIVLFSISPVNDWRFVANGSLGKHFVSGNGFLNPTITPVGANIIQTVSATNQNNLRAYQFAQSGLNYIDGRIPLESSVLNSSFTFKPIWKTTTATTGNVVWNAQAIFRNAGDPEDTAWGSVATSTSAAVSPAGATIIAPEVTVTPAVPSGNPNKRGVLEFRLYRNGGSGSDTLADAATLVDVELGLTVIGGYDS